MKIFDRIKGWLYRRPRVQATARPGRGRIDHVIIIDGSMSSLRAGEETNAGILYKLLCEVAPHQQLSLRYEAGIQWHNWRSSRDVIEGRGINRQIRRVYGFIASRYQPGDRIFLFGYSRGAYAVRSLAGVIDQVGLLRRDQATVRNIRQVYRQYQAENSDATASEFRAALCHDNVEIEMVGVWDTVKALGLRLPVLWRWTQASHLFHSHELGPHIRHGFHALARDETRAAFAPVMWTTPPGDAEAPVHVEQIWFRGAHGDVGGQLGGIAAARPLANIPLVWMLGKAETCGLPLPEAWRDRFQCDVTAPSVGTLRGWGKMFIGRRRRRIGADPSESLHVSIAEDPATPSTVPDSASSG